VVLGFEAVPGPEALGLGDGDGAPRLMGAGTLPEEEAGVGGGIDAARG
jgi:hypothetical protein